jgi:hypothetical protein
MMPGWLRANRLSASGNRMVGLTVRTCCPRRTDPTLWRFAVFLYTFKEN